MRNVLPIILVLFFCCACVLFQTKEKTSTIDIENKNEPLITAIKTVYLESKITGEFFESKYDDRTTIVRIDKILGRKVQIAVPFEMIDDTPRPLVISLHGYGGSHTFQNHMFPAVSFVASKDFILATPRGISRSWSFSAKKNRDIDFVVGLIKALKERYPVDSKKVFLVGHSNGAVLALNVACKGTIVAGVVSIGGFVNYPDGENVCWVSPKPTIFIHGLKDSIVPYSEGFASYNRLVAANFCKGSSSKGDAFVGEELMKIEEAVFCQDNTLVAMLGIEDGEHIKPLSPDLTSKVLDRLFDMNKNSY